MVEETTLTINTVASSRYVGFFAARVMQWQAELRVLQQSVEEMSVLQKDWMYYSKIFSSADIAKQLVTESAIFSDVEQFWRMLMIETSRSPLVRKICLAPGRLDALRAKNAALSNLQRELDGYLETKRVIFPRFYFLTNEEIVQFLASVRQPDELAGLVTKCFDGMAQAPQPTPF